MSHAAKRSRKSAALPSVGSNALVRPPRVHWSRVIEDESEKEFKPRECFNCKQVKPARIVTVHSYITRESRGGYPLCFDCFGPVVRWRNDAGKVIESPCPRPNRHRPNTKGQP